MINVCCLSHLAVGFCYGRPSRLIGPLFKEISVGPGLRKCPDRSKPQFKYLVPYPTGNVFSFLTLWVPWRHGAGTAEELKDIELWLSKSFHGQQRNHKNHPDKWSANLIKRLSDRVKRKPSPSTPSEPHKQIRIRTVKMGWLVPWPVLIVSG